MKRLPVFLLLTVSLWAQDKAPAPVFEVEKPLPQAEELDSYVSCGQGYLIAIRRKDHVGIEIGRKLYQPGFGKHLYDFYCLPESQVGWLLK